MILATVLRHFFHHGRLTLIDARGERHRICSLDGPTVVFRVTDRATERKLLRCSSTAWGEAYMDGGLVIEEGSLAEFLEILEHSDKRFDATAFSELRRRLYSVFAAGAHYNPISRARQNVAHHYDLSAELYDQFLDVDRQYSCAYFRSGDEDIETAQLLKKRHIAAKLDIRPGMRVLDIGSGWGGLALYLAKQFDCHVTGVTLSEEQLKLSRQRARDAGLGDRVSFELRDYRTLEARFDRIVSVGMLEHVGQFHYGEYFRKVRDLLEPDGVALIHTIARMNKPRPINAWIRKYIFPGAYLPSASQLTRAIENTGLWLTDFENLRLHYAETLKRWHERFAANRGRVAELYDERFCRMWELYLLGCEATFRYLDITVFQLQLTRDVNALPITRDYMYEVERELARKDRATVTSILQGKRPQRKRADSARTG